MSEQRVGRTQKKLAKLAATQAKPCQNVEYVQDQSSCLFRDRLNICQLTALGKISVLRHREQAPARKRTPSKHGEECHSSLSNVQRL